MSAKGNKTSAEAVEAVAENKTQPAPNAASTGRRARSSFMMKNFADRDWIMKNVVGKGKDEVTGKYTAVTLGRVFGIVSGVSEKKGTLPDGTPSVSQVLNGMFETEDYTTGEVSTASSLYLSNPFGMSIKTIFAADDTIKAVKIDCDIGVEATGKSIPYAWVVTNHIEGEDVSPLKQMKSARKTPKPALAASVAPKQLTAG